MYVTHYMKIAHSLGKYGIKQKGTLYKATQIIIWNYRIQNQTDKQ